MNYSKNVSPRTKSVIVTSSETTIINHIARATDWLIRGTRSTKQPMMSSDEDPAPDVEPFPCLYDEVMEMSLSAASVFGIADLRRLTRSGDFEDQTILQLPASGGDIKAFFQAHKELLKEKIKTRDYNALSILFDDGPGQRDDRSTSSSSSSFQDVVNCATLHHLGDENASHECVYAVSSNSMRKRIVVSFRGSITVQDWIQDSKFIMADVTNSFRGVDPESPETVQIHYGFKQYLYDDAPSILPSSVHSIVPTANKSGSSLNSNAKGIQHGEREVSNISTKQSKIEEILEKVQTLLDEHPGYKVYVAGHSLGGALSLVFAMEAASKLVTKQAVTCIVLGNPRTGNLAFRQVIHVSLLISIFNWYNTFRYLTPIFSPCFLMMPRVSKKKAGSVACAFTTSLT